MHRATRLTLGTVGIGLLAAFMVLGLTGSTLFASGPAAPVHSVGHDLSAALAKGAAPHPAATGNATSVAFAVTGMPVSYSYLPTWLNLTISGDIANNTTGTIVNTWTPADILTTNTNGTVWLVDELTNKSLTPISIPIANGTDSYSIPIDSATLNCTAANCTATLGSDAYKVYAYVATNCSAFGGTSAVTSASFLDSVAFITFAPNFGGVGGTTVVAGNISVSVYYSGQYITLTTLNIYNGTKLVFSSTFVNNATTGAPQVKTWLEGTPGVYLTSVVGQTPYKTFYTNSTITVLSPTQAVGSIVFYNTTIYQNVTGGTSPTGYFGLGPAVSGTLLLIIGLIVGILAALVAGRMMWSAPPSQPAKAWDQSKGGAATNTCSVCGKSFGSADELSAHQKSEHGM